MHVHPAIRVLVVGVIVAVLFGTEIGSIFFIFKADLTYGQSVPAGN